MPDPMMNVRTMMLGKGCEKDVSSAGGPAAYRLRPPSLKTMILFLFRSSDVTLAHSPDYPSEV